MAFMFLASVAGGDSARVVTHEAMTFATRQGKPQRFRRQSATCGQVRPDVGKQADSAGNRPSPRETNSVSPRGCSRGHRIRPSPAKYLRRAAGRLRLQNPRPRRCGRGFCMRRRVDAHVAPRWPDVPRVCKAPTSGPAPGRDARGRTSRDGRGGGISDHARACASVCASERGARRKRQVSGGIRSGARSFPS